MVIFSNSGRQKQGIIADRYTLFKLVVEENQYSKFKYDFYHGLIQKEKVQFYCDKGTQINMLANKIAAQ